MSLISFVKNIMSPDDREAAVRKDRQDRIDSTNAEAKRKLAERQAARAPGVEREKLADELVAEDREGFIEHYRADVEAEVRGTSTELSKAECAVAMRKLGITAAGFNYDVKVFKAKMAFEQQLENYDEKLAALASNERAARAELQAAEAALAAAKTKFRSAETAVRALESARVNYRVLQDRNPRIFGTPDQLVDFRSHYARNSMPY
jgi:chromosome segregation ATPase